MAAQVERSHNFPKRFYHRECPHPNLEFLDSFNILLVIWTFHIIHPNHTHLPIPQKSPVCVDHILTGGCQTSFKTEAFPTLDPARSHQ